MARQNHFILGVKLVRGAYMEKERNRAAQRGYPSPIQKDKTATDKDFNDAIEYVITNINEIASVIATHNEQSNLKAV
ncbi:proline dehydrogenase family protein, partial [Acinetobacter baumannii]